MLDRTAKATTGSTVQWVGLWVMAGNSLCKEEGNACWPAWGSGADVDGESPGGVPFATAFRLLPSLGAKRKGFTHTTAVMLSLCDGARLWTDNQAVRSVAFGWFL